MDYYGKLRIAPNASPKEIEQAYKRLIKEARYDTTINTHEVENAYKVLSSLPAKNQYDTQQTMRLQKTTGSPKQKRRVKEFRIVTWVKNLTRGQLLLILGICMSLMISYYSLRFGYLLKTFQAGDVLYDKTTHQHFGKVLKVEPNHSFGSKTLDAFQVELDPSSKQMINHERVVWLPQKIVKSRCYKKGPATGNQ